METSTITEIIKIAKIHYINKLKGKYWGILSMELSKRIPDEFKEVWENNVDQLKALLKKISTDSRAVVFKDDGGVFRVASHVDLLIDNNYPNDGSKSAMITYHSGIGDMSVLKTKMLLPSEHGKSWLILYNNERNINEAPIADIDLRNIYDKFSLETLAEYGAAIFFLSATAKGIVEIMKNSKNAEITEESVTKALLNGVFINNMGVAFQGNDRYSKVVADNKLTGGENMNVVNFSTAADYKTHQENLLSMEQEFFTDKGLKVFKKIGTYNAQTAEIETMQEDKVAGLFEKIIHIEKNVSKALLFLTGSEVQFKFNLDLKNIVAAKNNPAEAKEGTLNNE